MDETKTVVPMTAVEAKAKARENAERIRQQEKTLWEIEETNLRRQALSALPEQMIKVRESIAASVEKGQTTAIIEFRYEECWTDKMVDLIIEKLHGDGYQSATKRLYGFRGPYRSLTISWN